MASTKIFERLAYYLGRSLILIFITTTVAQGGLGLSPTDCASIQSNLTAFAYLGPIIGGIIVYRYIEARYTSPIGMLLAGLVYYFGSTAKDAIGIYLMIICVSSGLALFKTGPLMGRIITDSEQMDSAFSIRYSLVNVGAFTGTFLVGIFYKDTFTHDGVLGFSPCFKLAALMMVFGAIWLVFSWRYLGDVGKKPFRTTKTKEELEREAKMKEHSKNDRHPLSKLEKNRIGAIILVSTFSIIFWIFWYLAYLPVYYHWAKHINWTIGGYQVPATWFDAGDSLFCILSGPLTAWLRNKLAARPQGDISLFKN